MSSSEIAQRVGGCGGGASASSSPSLEGSSREKPRAQQDDQMRTRLRLLWRKIMLKLFEIITLRNVLNAAFILSVSVICFRQCYNQVHEYLKFKTRIQVSHSLPTNTIFLLPGVTICNNNRLRLDKLAEDVPEIKDDVAKVLNATTAASLSDRRRIELLRSIKRAVDESANITQIIVESPIEKLMEMSRSAMIKDINCNTSWGKQINCENLRIIESFQGGPCYTAFYMGSLLEALANGSAFEFRTSLLNGTRKLSAFESHEVAEILIDFGPLQHGDTHQDIGGKVAIHSTAHVGSIRDVAHTILPGYKYEVIVQRQMCRRLPPPYDTMCYDYKYNNSPLFYGDKVPSANVELDKTTCTRNCIIRRTLKACNCWPIEVPYYPSDTFDLHAGTYRMCSWGFQEIYGHNFSSTHYIECYRKFHAECRAICRPGCRTEDYRVHIVSNPWPGREKFLQAATAKETQELSVLRGCCALISIKYSDFLERRHIMIPKLTLAQLVSNIGGIVSALVGVSMITIYRYITRNILHCKTVNERFPPDLMALQLELADEAAGRRQALGPRLRLGHRSRRGVTSTINVYAGAPLEEMSCSRSGQMRTSVERSSECSFGPTCRCRRLGGSQSN